MLVAASRSRAFFLSFLLFRSPLSAANWNQSLGIPEISASVAVAQSLYFRKVAINQTETFKCQGLFVKSFIMQIFMHILSCFYNKFILIAQNV